MSIIKRRELGRPLTWDELDGNFSQVESLVSTANSSVNIATQQAQLSQQSSVESQQASQQARIAASNASSAVAQGIQGVYNSLSSSEVGKGASQVVTTSGNTVENSLKETLSVKKDFNALGDGVHDDTAAIQQALNYFSKGGKLHFPAGTYNVTSLVYQPSDRIPIVLEGDGVDATVIRKIGSSTSPLISIGKNPSAFFLTNIVVRGMTIDAVNKTSDSALQMFDCWFTELSNIKINGGKKPLEMLTPIFLNASDLTIQNGNTGLNIDYFTGESFAGSQPGVLRFTNCVIQNNSTVGVSFDSGEGLTFVNCAFEGNGTTTGSASDGAIYVGANVGRFMTGTVVPGLTLENCHFESNKGLAGVRVLSGKTLIDNVFFWEGANGTTSDISIEGGNYTVRNCTAASVKSPNLSEGSSTLTGNMVIQSDGMKTLSVNEAKTIVIGNRLVTSPYFMVGGTTGPDAAITYRNTSTFWQHKQLATSSFGLYNGTSLINYSDSTGAFLPGTDNNKTLGNPANRWGQIYSGTSTISTSDRNFKTEETPISDKEKKVALKLKALLKKFKYIEAVEEKGKSGARWHFGIIAQDVEAAFKSEGLDAFEYGLLCFDEWSEIKEESIIHPAEEKTTAIIDGVECLASDSTEEWVQVTTPHRAAGQRYGVRYEELLVFIVSVS